MRYLLHSIRQLILLAVKHAYTNGSLKSIALALFTFVDNFLPLIEKLLLKMSVILTREFKLIFKTGNGIISSTSRPLIKKFL